MADVPIAPQPFSLGATIDPRAFSDAFSKVGNTMTSALETGAKMGYQRNQTLQAQQALAMEQQKLEQEKQKAEVTQNLEKFGKLTDLYKNTHKSLRPKLWPTVAQNANKLLGTNFDPSIMPENASDSIEAAHNEIQLLLDKKQSFGDTMKKLGMLAVDVDEETRKAVEASKDFLMNTDEGAKIKSQGAGTFTFQGYDPVTKQPISTNSKSPGFVDTGGKPFSGPLQSKADFDKTTEEIRKVDNISSSVDDLGSLLQNVPSGAKGGWESAVTAAPGGNLIYQQAAQYQDQLPSIAVTFYRTATGDTRLSDDDAKKRALPFLPKLQDTSDVREKKLEVVKAMLERRKEGLSHGVFETSFDPNHSEVKTKPKIDALSTGAKDLISKWENK